MKTGQSGRNQARTDAKLSSQPTSEPKAEPRSEQAVNADMSMTKAELIELAASMGINTVGTKSELIERIVS